MKTKATFLKILTLSFLVFFLFSQSVYSYDSQILENKKQDLMKNLGGKLPPATQLKALNLFLMINSKNEKLCQNYLNYLENSQNFLNKILIKAKENKGESNPVFTQIATLNRQTQEMIFEARNVVQSQKEKIYEIKIEKDYPVGFSFRKTIEDLRSDHLNLRENHLKKLAANINLIFQIFKKEIKNSKQ
jgi:hypothetical protein